MADRYKQNGWPASWRLSRSPCLPPPASPRRGPSVAHISGPGIIRYKQLGWFENKTSYSLYSNENPPPHMLEMCANFQDLNW